MSSYIMAVIRLPLEIQSDGTFTALNDNIDFEFIPIKELPPKKENGMKSASLELDEILGLFTKNELRRSSLVVGEDSSSPITKKNMESVKYVFLPNNKIEKRIRNKNTTFKNSSSHITHNYSTKCWKQSK